MITCRDCSKQFPKPVRRGRPPVRCDSCKNGETVSPTSSEIVSSEPTIPVVVEPVKNSRNKKIVTGFCNPRHSSEIHLMCGGRFGCVCSCHV